MMETVLAIPLFLVVIGGVMWIGDLMVAKETLGFAREVLEDRVGDPRLAKMGAIVFLAVKPKGRAKDGFGPASADDYGELISFCQEHGIKFGFDSCGAPKFEQWARKHCMARAAGEYFHGRPGRFAALEDSEDPELQSYLQQSERCESFLFSLYVNVDGRVFPCSFCEGEEGWEQGIDLLAAKDFAGVWYHPRAVEWRHRLLANRRECPMFKV